MDPTATKSRLQTLLDTEPLFKGASVLNIVFPGVPVIAVTPTPPKPVVRVITQTHSQWAADILDNCTAPTVIANEQITDGGFFRSVSTAPVSITNCSNQKGNTAGGGMYWLMLWPSALPDGTQQAVSKCTVNATGCTIYQGTAEAAIRLKCDDFQMTGGTIVAHLQPNGQQIKPIVEIRHGKSFAFTGTTFQDGWPEIGEQSTAQADGASKLETSQHPDLVTFTNCKFTRWQNPASKSVVSRKPGVQHVVYANCVGPDGKTFSRTE